MDELGSAELFGDAFGAARMWGLRETPMQDVVSLFPQTSGWLLLLLLLLALIAITRWRRYQTWKQQAFRRDAIRSLTHMQDDLSQIKALPQLLRHVALRSSPREEVVGLHGSAWIAWLNVKAGSRVFDDADAKLLNQLAYAGHSDIDPAIGQRLIAASLQWVSVDHV